MPRSVIHKQSFGTVKVFWLDRSLLKSRIMQAARSLSREHEEVVQVVLFGSVASGRAVPSSDADILVVVRDSDTPFLDRASLFRGYFSDIGSGGGSIRVHPTGGRQQQDSSGGYGAPDRDRAV